MNSDGHDDLFSAALECLLQAQPERKRVLTAATAQAFREGRLSLAGHDAPVQDVEHPGRPERPRLIAARKLPQRGLGSAEGRAAFVHAIAHIEFNAINLAWDAVYRFRGMPDAFYADWVAVADDEARHFSLLRERLRSLGFDYGDFDAHDGLWEMARKTAHQCLARMALVPRVLEARGLDVTPGMISRLRGIGDSDTAAILDVILREEVAHVAAGSRWFLWCCEREGVDPQTTFANLLREHALGALRGPFNRPARQAAGFSDDEMSLLDQLAASERT
ncbi:MAG: ferritin-like domain-containing protein [Xanthomonadaceae bacterium]|nr:ferritin-like domain-containing protein [Xanthomonadaceae bacterium]MDP2185870.1 ferritin-like domain-containing protein [Xanthomonadales bacterium]MDZ4117217.1 ferritin-like domain-containing protein [Xanthomonadaceae bacterium]MDZ4378831.1 ferritin-like domain-containing protein [Xanthomonadaceae bacterium]